jgi:hypothetical protein
MLEELLEGRDSLTETPSSTLAADRHALGLHSSGSGRWDSASPNPGLQPGAGPPPMVRTESGSHLDEEDLAIVEEERLASVYRILYYYHIWTSNPRFYSLLGAACLRV